MIYTDFEPPSRLPYSLMPSAKLRSANLPLLTSLPPASRGDALPTRLCGSGAKRPRGLGDLLGHLLFKRIAVMHKLSSTKIPVYLSYKYIQGHQNCKCTEWPQTDSEHLTMTLQALKTYLSGWNFDPFCSTSTGFRDIRNRKCTEWPPKLNLNT